jgi:hypothetical protein
VARVKSTARPMTIEELAVAGLPAEPEVQDPEIVQPSEDTPLLLVAGLGFTKMGRLDQRRKKSEMSTLMSRILLQQSNRGLFLRPLSSGSLKLPPIRLESTRQLDSFMSAADAPHWTNKFLLPKRMRSSYFATSSLAD